MSYITQDDSLACAGPYFCLQECLVGQLEAVRSLGLIQVGGCLGESLRGEEADERHEPSRVEEVGVSRPKDWSRRKGGHKD